MTDAKMSAWHTYARITITSDTQQMSWLEDSLKVLSSEMDQAESRLIR